MAIIEGGQCADLAHSGVRAIHEVAAKPPGLLREGLLRSRRSHRGVRQDVVNSTQSRRVDIAEPGCRHRCRLTRECAQAISVRMSGNIDQDINTIRANALGKLRIVHTRCGYPAIEVTFQAARDVILCAQLCIAIQFEARAVGMLKKGFDKPIRRVLTKIR
ncbi:hypothetical protein D3C72_1687080 [compost metagenome]